MTMAKPDGSLFVGVDVGTQSVRAAVVNAKGTVLSSETSPISLFNDQGDFYEQSSSEIWSAVCMCVRNAVDASGQDPARVQGIGFDATCSLVVLGEGYDPLPVDREGKQKHRNVIVWMDHRAVAEAEFINSTKHEVIEYVGGVISPEMESPKLLWLKKNLPTTFRSARRFLDLADFLTFRATGDDTRSVCTTVCKWTYLAHCGGWSDSYWKQIGLGEFVDEKYNRIGQRIRPLGEAVGSGLTETAAKELNLPCGTKCSTGVIDAHAGGIGMLGASMEFDEGRRVDSATLESRIAILSGTSACLMAVNRDQRVVPGVWGPYFSAMVPGMWLTEGGQSAAGVLLDHIIDSSAVGKEWRGESQSVYSALTCHLRAMATAKNVRLCEMTKEIHVLPYFHGNRSPRADPTLTGSITGLKLSRSKDDLALLYLATIQALAYGTKHILQALNEQGMEIRTIFLSGGNAKNELFVQELSDITRCRVVIPTQKEAMLVGSAVVAAVASGEYGTVVEAMVAMNTGETLQTPSSDPSVQVFHRNKYDVFLELYNNQMKCRDLMERSQ